MIRKNDIQKQLETFLAEKGIKYTYINKILKNIPMPTYIVKIRVFSGKAQKIKDEISIEILIFHSVYSISFEISNIYKISKEKYCSIFKKINYLNRYSLPGKFIINDENYICYRCIWHYQNYEKLDEKTIENIMDSLIPAYYLCLDKLTNKKGNGKITSEKR